MVLASVFVDSDKRLAARPVGAHSSTFTPLARMIRRMLLTTVVLPTPGPPVITVTLPLTARATASRWDFELDVAHTGLGADQGVVGNTQPLGDGIGGHEPDTVDVEGQAVGVLAHPLHRLVAVGLVDAHRPGGADAMGLQKYHDLAHDLLLRPGAGHPFLALGSDALQFQQSLGLLLDDVEDLLAESADQLAGEMRADALDHARAQVLLDAFKCRGRDDPQLLGLELQAVLAVVGPGAGALDIFPGVMLAAEPMTVTNSRWPRTLTRSTQKPLSGLWKVTRSTDPCRYSVAVAGARGCCGTIRLYAFGVNIRSSLFHRLVTSRFMIPGVCG